MKASTPFPAVFIFEGPGNICFDIDPFEPIHPPWQAIRGWIPDDEDEAPDAPLELWDRSTTPAWTAPEIDLGDGRTLVLEYTERPRPQARSEPLERRKIPPPKDFLARRSGKVCSTSLEFHHESRPYPTADFETARPDPMTGAFHPSSLKFDPSTAPLSPPQTPSLPVPDPANDATGEKQIPFRNVSHAHAVLLPFQKTASRPHCHSWFVVVAASRGRTSRLGPVIRK